MGQKFKNLVTGTKTEVARVRRGFLPNPWNEPGRDVDVGSRDAFGRKTQQNLSAHYGAQFCKDIAQGAAITSLK